jgi:hypothetical protein
MVSFPLKTLGRVYLNAPLAAEEGEASLLGVEGLLQIPGVLTLLVLILLVLDLLLDLLLELLLLVLHLVSLLGLQSLLCLQIQWTPI